MGCSARDPGSVDWRWRKGEMRVLRHDVGISEGPKRSATGMMHVWTNATE